MSNHKTKNTTGAKTLETIQRSHCFGATTTFTTTTCTVVFLFTKPGRRQDWFLDSTGCPTLQAKIFETKMRKPFEIIVFLACTTDDLEFCNKTKVSSFILLFSPLSSPTRAWINAVKAKPDRLNHRSLESKQTIIEIGLRIIRWKTKHAQIMKIYS